MFAGTSGCKHDGNYINKFFGMNEQQLEYIDLNREELIAEMASGNGEVLTGFAEMLGCEQGVRQDLYETARKNFPTIYSNENASSPEILHNLKIKMLQNGKLRSGCSTLWG
jgi:hypothetical protein